MNYIDQYLREADTAAVTEEELKKTENLLQLYGRILRRSAQCISEYEAECFESRRQEISDFINLAIDYENDTDRKRIAARLADMGHSMQLLKIMEEALLLMRDNSPNGGMYYRLIRTRYFDAYCASNEDAFLTLGISSSTYYRNIRSAIRSYAENLWCVVVPDRIIREQGLDEILPDQECEGQMRVS